MSDQPTRLLWKPGAMLYPVPAVLISCGDFDGHMNLVTVAWTGTVCSDPPMCSISLRPERFSYNLIRESGEFTVNLTTAAMARAVDWCGVKSGREVDKFKEMQLTPLRASQIRAPLVAESPINLECRVTEVRELGSHHLFLAEVLAVQADPAFHRGNTGYFDLAAAAPICYCHGHYHRMGKHIGKFGFSVKKKPRKSRR
ncbi:MAG TPA: flavin reductase family protein [Candidatus Aminicenantes bacterium]|nr:flavin reductase family protein [Candidatus Aminicenantes bacterium]